MKETMLASFSELSALAERTREQKFIFRGVVNHEYELIPKVGRSQYNKIMEKHGRGKVATAVRFSSKHEELAFEEFKRRARAFRDEPLDDWEWLAIAQHHGMATRLLDWTESLYVAAFFATEKAGDQPSDAAIYAAPRPSEISLGARRKSPLKVKRATFFRPAHYSPRVIAQSGAFTINPEPENPALLPGLLKYRIPKGQCWRFKETLAAIGINHAVLFPDIDGVGEYVAWLYKWRKV